MPEDGSKPRLDRSELKAALTTIVGSDNIRDDQNSIALHSADIWSAGTGSIALIVSPRSIEQVSQVVAAVNNAGFVIAPRGAGMSYTGGYIPVVEGTVSLDMSRMDRILAISREDMTVTVEAGCNWAKLNDALSPLGLRTPFWGPMSGLISTIGGGLSQLNAMLGGSHYGTSSESVIALSMVLADGQILRTGARGVGGNAPFYRHYGPDLAGLFCGDSGVFGIKAEITMRLIQLPKYEAYVSFSFKTGRDLLLGMAEMTRAGIASEMCAFDPGLTKVRLARASLVSDIKTLGAVITKQKSLLKGLVEAGKVALGGRNFIEPDDYPLHVIVEGRSQAVVDADLAEARRIGVQFGGTEIENTIAKVIRAIPFPPLNSVLGPAGERWAPIHAQMQLSQAPAVFDEIQAVFAAMKTEFEREGISFGYLFTGVSTNALIIEPVFYWPESSYPVHEAAMEPGFFAKLPKLASNPAATTVVKAARKRILDIFTRYGCGHYQIGRTYPYRASRDQASWTLLETIKATIDPKGIFNPGALGLGPKGE